MLFFLSSGDKSTKSTNARYGYWQTKLLGEFRVRALTSGSSTRATVAVASNSSSSKIGSLMMGRGPVSPRFVVHAVSPPDRCSILFSICTLGLVLPEEAPSTHDEEEETRDRSPSSKGTLTRTSSPESAVRTTLAEGRGSTGRGTGYWWKLGLTSTTRDTEPYNSVPVFGSVWKAERAGKIKLFQKPGAFPSPRQARRQIQLRSLALRRSVSHPLTSSFSALSVHGASLSRSAVQPPSFSLAPPVRVEIPSLSNHVRSTSGLLPP